jgi:hypothetical protein
VSLKVFVVATAVGAAALGAASLAQAEPGRTAVFVIHEAPVPTGEQIAAKGEPLLRQKATATRAAVLDEAVAAPFGKIKTFPAGTKMFGVSTNTGGTAFCAVASMGWWSGDQFACYLDSDHDGAFDQVMPSGSPFMGVALFVFDLGAPTPLPAPVRYHRLPYGEGPAIDFGLTWSARKDKSSPTGSTTIQVDTALQGRAGLQTISGTGRAVKLFDGVASDLTYRGAGVTLLGMTPDGGLRYRVQQTLPSQLTSIVMSVTYTTTYVPIFIPR